MSLITNQTTTSLVQELKTLRDFVRWALTNFNRNHLYYGHGTDNAWDEALHLVLGSLHLQIGRASCRERV